MGGIDSVESSRGGVSMERQTRLANGLLALGMALAGYFSPLFLGLTLLMGLGLIFSGLSGFCGFAVLLARAPWNQDRASRSKA